MLSMLSNLECFYLVFTNKRVCSWEKFSLELKQAFVTICASSTLIKMTLVSVSDLPPMLFKWLVLIPNLELRFTRFSTDQEEEEKFLQKPTTNSQCRIRKSLALCRVHCDDSNLLMNGLLPQNSQLERLDLRAASEILLAFSTGGKCRIFMTALSLPYNLSHDDVQNIDISSLPRLKRVEFWSYLIGRESFEAGRGILSKVKDGNDLQEIVIHFHGTSTLDLILADTSGWKILDGMLSGFPFTQLKKIYLSNVSMKEVHNLDHMNAWVADKFPILYGRGMMDWIWEN
ncbi:hypothetical protein BDQ17DRAFT_529953 [Cyathus striatus]|nr:hypothetical protein BDQ17DRAFT_529953 [Cyathus striatus]